jgi:hypothetical protein
MRFIRSADAQLDVPNCGLMVEMIEPACHYVYGYPAFSSAGVIVHPLSLVRPKQIERARDRFSEGLQYPQD